MAKNLFEAGDPCWSAAFLEIDDDRDGETLAVRPRPSGGFSCGNHLALGKAVGEKPGEDEHR